MATKYEYMVIREFHGVDDDRLNITHCPPTDDSRKAMAIRDMESLEGDGEVKFYFRAIGDWELCLLVSPSPGVPVYAPAAPWTAPKPKQEPAHAEALPRGGDEA